MSAGAGSQLSARGLCPDCAHVKLIRTASGSQFLLCTRHKSDVRFPKYPPQPVRRCPGFEAEVQP